MKKTTVLLTRSDGSGVVYDAIPLANGDRVIALSNGLIGPKSSFILKRDGSVVNPDTFLTWTEINEHPF